MPADDTFTKHRPGAAQGFFQVEAAGLDWLAAAQPGGGAPVAQVRSTGPDRIVLERLRPVAPSPQAARELGRRLAATHDSAAAGFGCPPPGWTGDGFIGPIPLPHAHGQSLDAIPPQRWPEFYARYRIQPFARQAAELGALTQADRHAVDRICRRLIEGDVALAGPPEPPSRLHGDLWSGNVIWTAGGAVLIDPAAHGGHRETDLAMLALFGSPFLDVLLAGYQQAHSLASGWRDRIPLHQLHPLLVHAVLFGPGYGAQAGAAARHYL